jgi:hypothetical protein
MLRRVKVVKDRKVNTYSELWRVSYWTLDQAKSEKKGSYFQIMASLVFTAFTLEAYLNHIGQTMFEDWKDTERNMSPYEKMDLIAKKLDLKIDYGKRPFQTMKQLLEFRNDIAHGKTVLLQEEKTKIVNLDNDEYMHNTLETGWEKYCTLTKATRARNDIESIIKAIHNLAGIKDDTLFFGGLSSSHGKLLQ